MGIEEQPLPWATGPSDQGATPCAWCYRDIYLPALPCSVSPVEGLARMRTRPGFGRRCQYELATRRPDLVNSVEAAVIFTERDSPHAASPLWHDEPPARLLNITRLDEAEAITGKLD